MHGLASMYPSIRLTVEFHVVRWVLFGAHVCGCLVQGVCVSWGSSEQLYSDGDVDLGVRGDWGESRDTSVAAPKNTAECG